MIDRAIQFSFQFIFWCESWTGRIQKRNDTKILSEIVTKWVLRMHIAKPSISTDKCTVPIHFIDIVPHNVASHAINAKFYSMILRQIHAINIWNRINIYYRQVLDTTDRRSIEQWLTNHQFWVYIKSFRIWSRMHLPL